MKGKWVIFCLAILGVLYPVLELLRHVISNENMQTFPYLEYAFYAEFVFVIAGFLLTILCLYALTRSIK